MAAAGAGAKLVAGPLGERPVGASGEPLPLGCGLQAELSLLELHPRLFKLAAGGLVGGLLEATLDQLDDGTSDAETTLLSVGFQGLFERVGNPGVDDRAHSQRTLARYSQWVYG